MDDTLCAVIRAEAWLLLIALAAAVGYGMLVGRINTRQLLCHELDGRPSAERAQLLVLTLVAAFALVAQTTQDPGNFAEVPDAALIAYGGSQAIYLLGKARWNRRSP